MLNYLKKGRHYNGKKKKKMGMDKLLLFKKLLK